VRKKLRLDTLKVDTFEPAQPVIGDGSVYGYSGQYGPACASEDPNCTGLYGPACRSQPPNCNVGGQTSRCV
jgi:hypothetical protein